MSGAPKAARASDSRLVFDRRVFFSDAGSVFAAGAAIFGGGIDFVFVPRGLPLGFAPPIAGGGCEVFEGRGAGGRLGVVTCFVIEPGAFGAGFGAAGRIEGAFGGGGGSSTTSSLSSMWIEARLTRFARSWARSAAAFASSRERRSSSASDAASAARRTPLHAFGVVAARPHRLGGREGPRDVLRILRLRLGNLG